MMPAAAMMAPAMSAVAGDGASGRGAQYGNGDAADQPFSIHCHETLNSSVLISAKDVPARPGVLLGDTQHCGQGLAKCVAIGRRMSDPLDAIK